MKSRFYLNYLIIALLLLLLSSIFYESTLDLRVGEGFCIVPIPVIGMIGSAVFAIYCFLFKSLQEKRGLDLKGLQAHLIISTMGLTMILFCCGRPSLLFQDDENIFSKISLAFYLGTALIILGQFFLFNIIKRKPLSD